MKQNNFFKKTLLLLAMVAGVSTAWAINIPQDLGTYIAIGTVPSSGDKTTATGVSLTNCQVDGNAGATDYTSYTIGSTNKNSSATFNLSNSTKQDYLFTFFSGSKDQAGKVSFTLSDGGTYSVKKEFDISDTDAWNLTERHVAVFEDVPATSLTLTFEVESTGEGFYGNYGNISFTGANQLPMPYDDSHLLDVTRATTSGMKINGTYLTEITTNSYADDIYMYVSQEGWYSVYAGYGYATAGTDNFTITITDLDSGTAEVNAQNFTVTDKKIYVMTGNITTGWKKIRLYHPCTTITTSFRLEKMYFTKIEEFPLTRGETLNLNQSTAIFKSCSYESAADKQNIGNIKGSEIYADNYYVYNSNEQAFYNLCANINWYKNSGTVKVTVTDVATSTEEATATSSSITATGNIMFKIDNAISNGLKKIRFDFLSATTNDYLFNIKNVSFYKRSLNDSYNYTPVAATGVDVVLTRNITAGNWSTICLPFAMTSAQLKAAFGNDVKVAALSSATENTLTFTLQDLTNDETTTVANQPYAIKVTSDFSSATINGVTIVEATPTQTVSPWQFVGTYSLVENMASGNYYFKSNKLWQATGTQKMKPFRGYFHYTGTAATAREVTFSIDEEVTGIAHIDADGQMTMNEGVAYDLQGRKVAQPTRGMYIVNGKKVIIK